MKRLAIIVAWIMLAVGGYVAVTGIREYWASRSGQTEAAQSWNTPEIASTDSNPIPGSTPKSDTSPAANRVQPGDSVAKLSIPRLSAVLYVVEGTDDKSLRRGPGHMHGTALPGVSGNCIIAGHRDTHFRVLKNIEKGDEIILETHAGIYRYKVNLISVISPNNTACLRPTSNAVLNLITCYPFHYVGSAPKRFIVHADLES